LTTKRREVKFSISPELMAQLVDILMKIVGESVHGKIARAIIAAALAGAAQMMSSSEENTLPPHAPKIVAPAAK